MNIYGNYNYYKKSEVCGIKNLGNNCYLNSGLQILVSCEELVENLNKYNYNMGNIIILLKEAFSTLLKKDIFYPYNPGIFIDSFSKLNPDFVIGAQCCSQNFIRTLIRNINKECIYNKIDLISNNDQYPKMNNEEYNEYEKFIEKLYPESSVQYIFSGITKFHSKGICPYCHKKIEKYSFNYFIDKIIYLDDLDMDYKYKFSDVLKENIGNYTNLVLDCPKCNEEIEIKEETKIIKLPNILIFTLERYQGTHSKVKILPDKILDMKEYIDKSLIIDSTLYELFAINIRFGMTENFGHEICQVKRDGIWYEINDSYGYKIKDVSHLDSSYGLFYKKIKPKNGIEKIDLINEVIIKYIKSENNFKKFIELINTKYRNLEGYKCSQEIIVNLIEELKNLSPGIINPNIKINTQTSAYTIFSFSERYDFYGECKICKKEFKYNQDNNRTYFSIILPNKKEANFQDILEYNKLNLFIGRPCFHNVKMKKNIQIIKLPEIFIFTLNRKNNKQINRIKIFADDIIEMKIYIDKKSTEAKRTTYKLFALNILIDNEHGYKHQIKMNEEWYEFYNDLKKIITNPDFSDSIYGLYYKRI